MERAQIANPRYPQFINNKAQTSDYLRFGINTTLIFVAVSSPIGLIAVGTYGVFDYYYGDKFLEKTGIDNY